MLCCILIPAQGLSLFKGTAQRQGNSMEPENPGVDEQGTVMGQISVGSHLLSALYSRSSQLATNDIDSFLSCLRL